MIYKSAPIFPTPKMSSQICGIKRLFIHYCIATLLINLLPGCSQMMHIGGNALTSRLERFIFRKQLSTLIQGNSQITTPLLGPQVLSDSSYPILLWFQHL